MHLFEQLDARYRERLASLAEELRLAAGEVLIRRGERGGDVFRLLSGRIEIVDSRSEPEVVLDVLGPGAVVGEMGHLDREPRSATVRVAEDAILARWRGEILDEALGADPELSAAFHRAVARVLAARIRGLTRFATRGGIVARSLESISADAASRARELAERLKSALVGLEGPLRAAEARAEKDLVMALDAFLHEGARLFSGFSFEEARGAGELLGRELHPYLVRSRLAEQLITRTAGPAGDPQALAHIGMNAPRGSDALGESLDRYLLATPTARSLRRRGVVLARLAIEAADVSSSPRVTVLPVGAGAVSSVLVEHLRAGELTCMDGSRLALGTLDAGVSARSGRQRVRPIRADLGLWSRGMSELYLRRQDLVVVDGLVDSLPDRVLASLGRVLLGVLAPGAVALVAILSDSPDRFVFDHLLGWRTVRREPGAVAELLGEVGLEHPEVVWREGAAAILSARRPARRPLRADARDERRP